MRDCLPLERVGREVAVAAVVGGFAAVGLVAVVADARPVVPDIVVEGETDSVVGILGMG